MKKYLFYIALLGYISVILIHGFTIFGIDLTSKFPFVWIFHLGAIIIMFPVIRELNKRPELSTLEKDSFSYNSFFGIIFKSTPSWLKYLAQFGFIYAVMNFIYFLATNNGTPELQNGVYSLQEHGNFIREISEQDYHLEKAKNLRGFSGHWIAFFGIATAILFPSKLK